MSKEIELGLTLYENENFQVVFTRFSDPVIGDEVEGYGIINKATGIREAEARRLAVAKSLADSFDRTHKGQGQLVGIVELTQEDLLSVIDPSGTVN